MTNHEFKIQLEKRTAEFSASVIKMLRKIPGDLESKYIREQVLWSATAVGVNCREAIQDGSSAEFVHRIGVVVIECSECTYWITLLHDLHPEIPEVIPVLNEASELTRAFDKIRRTVTCKGGGSAKIS